MTNEEKVIRVLACCGKAPKAANYLDESEAASVAALCGDDGVIVDGVQEAFRLIMVGHYERRKATSEEFEEPLVVGTGVDHPFVESEIDDPSTLDDEEE